MKLDLKELLAKIIGQIEIKTLLWTNTQGGQTSYTFTADLSGFDELEVEFERNGGLYRFGMATTGTATFVYPYGNYLVVREVTISGNTVTFGNGGYYSGYNSGTLINGATYAIPKRVFGKKRIYA